MQAEPFDLVVIGGGVNGAGIARDAAGRGIKVLLLEKSDLANATSSASTKLIHGGLRYLEYYDFRLVHHALVEREVLLRAAPHIIWPLRFVLPHSPEQRPAWLIRIGLFLYDHLGGRELLPGSRAIDLASHDAGGPLKKDYRKAFVYSDCWVDDSRLVVLNAVDARRHGATIRTRCEALSAVRGEKTWRVTYRDRRTGETHQAEGAALVNAAGPWVAEVLGKRLGQESPKKIRNVKGSHIVVRRLFDHPYPYIFQNRDRRIVFAIPYLEDYTLIGTTDLDYQGDPDRAAIDETEVAYLCEAINRYFEKPIAPEDVIWSYAGVRPLFDDDSKSASAATRDYILDFDQGAERAALLNVFGGKITTFRKLSEQAVDTIEKALGRREGSWTAKSALPGGDIPDADFDSFLADLQRRYDWLPQPLCRRLARAYGSDADTLLGSANSLEDLGQDFGAGLYQAEVDYLRAEEFAVTAEDILWRRSKLGLAIGDQGRESLRAYLEESRDGSARLAAQS